MFNIHDYRFGQVKLPSVSFDKERTRLRILFSPSQFHCTLSGRWFTNINCLVFHVRHAEHLVLQYLPAQTTEYVDIATSDDAKLDRQPVGRAHSGHATAAALGRENRTHYRKCRIWERFAGLGTGTAAVTRASSALGRIAGHT